MKIDLSNYIKEYLENTFPENQVVSAGKEFTCNSIFAEDDKKHLSVNLENGLWQCFKSGKKGNFISLVAAAEKIRYYEAKKKISSESINCIDLSKLDYYFGTSVYTEEVAVKSTTIDIRKLIPNAVPVTTAFLGHEECLSAAANFLLDRFLPIAEPDNIPIDYPFYYTEEGEFAGRLIIGYMSLDGEMLYFQARSLNPHSYPKYKNPGAITGFKSSEIVLPFMVSDEPLFVTEGPLDALTLRLYGHNATCLNGSFASKKQIQLLASHPGPIVLAFDNDEAGAKGAWKFFGNSLPLKKDEIYYTFPKGYKDWNAAHADQCGYARLDRLDVRVLDIGYQSQIMLDALAAL